MKMDSMMEFVIKEMKQDIRDINTKVDKLLQFKWQIIGGSLVASALITVVIQLALALIQRG